MTPEDAKEQSERYIAFLSQLKPLFVERRDTEVIRRVLRYRDEAEGQGKFFLASLCAQLLGDTLSSAGKRAEALAAYEDVYRLSPSPTSARAVARKLLSAGEGDRANKIASEMYEKDPVDAVELHMRVSFDGFVSLLMADETKAKDRLEEALRIASEADVPALEWDLALVTEMIQRGVAIEACRSYLRELSHRSTGRRYGLMRRVVAELLETLPRDHT